MATGLQNEIIYSFVVQARNAYGLSAYSAKVDILCAFKPEPPISVVTSNFGNSILIDWTPGPTNGLPITAYAIYIRKQDNTYAQNLMYCNGAYAVYVSGRQCTVPLADLTSTPFNLLLGDHVDVKVIASNVYGSSEFSAVGDGAVI